MKAILTILLFWACLLALMLGVVAEVDLREEKRIHRGQYIQWWTDRDLNQFKTEQEWTR